MPVGALIGSVAVGVGGSVLSSNAQSKAAGKASDAQVQATQLAVDEQRAAREQLQKLLAPYVAAGGPALQQQLNFLGLGPQGAAGQQAFIQQQQNNPIFQGLLKQGETSILQNASATGGLRGGNTQEALAQFSPMLLNQFITDQYNRLGGITQLGQNSAAGVGTAGMQTASNIGSLFGDMGAAQAGGYLAQGNAKANMYGGIAQGLSSILGMGVQKGWF